MLGFTPSLFWVDLEMTGLDPMKNTILQFACILSDSTLTNFEEGPHIVIHWDEQLLNQMDQWNTKHHRASGLYENSIKSQVSLQKAQEFVLQYIKSRGILPGQLIIAGNSVHMDKLFLFHHMPNLNSYLHYRILDVSSLKIIVNTLKPNLFYKKQNNHRALDDIKQSIGQLKFYIENCFSK